MSDPRPDGDQDRQLRDRFAGYSVAVEPTFAAPSLTELTDGGRRRRVRRAVSLVTAAAAVAALVAVGPVARGLLSEPGGTGGTPAGQPSADTLAAVPIAEATIDLPAWPAAARHCPATGPVRLSRGATTMDGVRYQVSDDLRAGTGQPGAPLVGRLDGLDEEARVVRVVCRPPGGDRFASAGLLVLTTGVGGGLRGLGYLTTPVLSPLDTSELAFSDGAIESLVVSTAGTVPVVQRRVFRWSGDRFRQVTGPTEPPKRLADVDPREWAYATPVGGQFGTDMISCPPWGSVVVRGGAGTVYGVRMNGDGRTCRAGTARLAGQATGTVPGAGTVLLVTLRVLIDGRQPGLFTYAFYEQRGSLTAQTLDARILADPGATPQQEIREGDLVVTAATALGERTFRYRWVGTAFQPA